MGPTPAISLISSPFVPAGLRLASIATFAARAINAIGGFSSAIFGTQLLAWFLKLETIGAIAGLSFLVGILSMAVLDAIVRGLAETRVGEFFNGVLQRLLAVIGVKREG